MTQSTTARRQSNAAFGTIDEDRPGSILRDFETLLGFVEQGLPSGGKHHLLPLARLSELDQRMTRPLRPRLNRPQQRSFPHLNGLYLLSRATELVVVEGRGTAAGRLTLEPAMHRQWLQLNATERYFNLLEAWLLRSSWGMIGLDGASFGNRVAAYAMELWAMVPRSGRQFSLSEQKSGSFCTGSERSCTLALLELFGLLDVDREEPAQGQNWRVNGVRRTAFGDNLLGTVFSSSLRDLLYTISSSASFGAWQSALQARFPLWQNNLTFPEPACRDGLYYFKVSLGTPWRRIAIPSTCDLDDLAEAIIEAFDFGGGHLYGFEIAGRNGRPRRIEHPVVTDADASTDEVAIGLLTLKEGESMEFQYDFGADWRFSVELEKVESVNAKITEPTVVASRGKAPAEYDYDEW